MILFDQVGKKYGPGRYALRNISLHIKKGEFVFITGESGAGKSTFLKILTKEEECSFGHVYVNGQDIKELKKWKIPAYKRKIGCIFQDFRLLDDRSVYENVAFAERVVHASEKKIERTVPQMLSMVGLSAKADALPHELSGGERQRVAIARALVNGAEIILADEPTGNLDELNSWEIMKLLDDVNRSGKTVVVVTHNLDIVKEMGRRTITFANGLLAEEVAGCRL